MPADVTLHLSTSADKAALDALVARMYAAFCNADGTLPDVDRLHELFLPDCVIAKSIGDTVETWGLRAFIEPRRLLLTDGRLTDFSEWETDERTWIQGNVANRWSLYAKSGTSDGNRFRTRGIKNLQFVKRDGQWWISALAWDDERPGLEIPDTFQQD